MPDLGKYATEVLSAYAVSLLLLFLIVAISIWRARRVKAMLAKLEAQDRNAKD